MSRTIERSIARREYEKFARRWREEKRFAGVYGKTGYRKPSFNEWYHMHQSDLEQMRQSSPADVQEHLGLRYSLSDLSSKCIPTSPVSSRCMMRPRSAE